MSKATATLLVLLARAAAAGAREIVEGFAIPDEYAATERPGLAEGSPTLVDCVFHVFNIQEVDESAQAVSLEAFVALLWRDPRLAVPGGSGSVEFAFLSDEALEAIWRPDLFLYNSLGMKVGSTYDKSLSVNVDRATGAVFWGTVYQLRVSCVMDFASYPLDSQSCPILFGSFTANSSNLVFTTVQLLALKNYEKKLPQYNVDVEDIPDHYKTYTSVVEGVGNFSRAGLTIHLRRRTLSATLNTFLPTGTLVLVSWISFLIPVELVPGRMALLVTLFLMLVNVAGSAATPPSPSPTALDVWLRGCMFFVAAALFEYAFLLKRVYPKGPPSPEPASRVEPVGAGKKLGLAAAGKKKKNVDADGVAIMAFPGAFLLFNLVFWIFYLA